jgi:hypothetical protein
LKLGQSTERWEAFLSDPTADAGTLLDPTADAGTLLDPTADAGTLLDPTAASDAGTLLGAPHLDLRCQLGVWGPAGTF